MNYLQQMVVHQAQLQQILFQIDCLLSQLAASSTHLTRADKPPFTVLQTQIAELEKTVQAIVSATAISCEKSSRSLSAAASELQADYLTYPALLQHSIDLLDRGSEGFLMIDRNWHILYLNARVEEVLQRPAADLLGKHFWTEFPAAISLTCHREYHRVLQEQVPTVFEDYYPPLDAWFEVRAYPIPEGIACYFLDISDRKQAEAEQQQARIERQQAEDRFSLAFHSSPIGMTITRCADGCFLDANESYLELVEYSRAELIGRTSSELGILTREERRTLLNLLEQPPVRNVEWTFHTKTGRVRTARVSIEKLDLTGEPCLLILAEDVTDYRQMQNELRDSEARLQLILENMPVILNAVDETGRFVMWNQEIERVTGIRKAEILGQPDGLALLYPDAEERNAMLDRWAETGGDFRNWEIPITIQDGSQRIISWSNLSKQFPIEGWMSWAIGIDVTERVVAERERQTAMVALSQLNQELEMRVQQRTQELEQSQEILRQQQQQFRSLVENIPDIVARMDRQLRHLYINPSVERMTGIPAARFIGKTFRQMGLPKAGISLVEPLLQSAFETGEMQSQVIEIPFCEQVFDITVVPERSAIGEVETILVIWRDVTRLKQAERALQEKEQQFRTLAENAPDMILRLDRQFRHLYVNPRFESLTGIATEAAVGKTSVELGFPPDLIQRWDEVNQTVFEMGSACTVEFEILTPEGIQTLHSLVVPEIDQAGGVASVLIVARDITSRKQAETDLLYAIERLEQLNHLKDDFLSTVSHELRTPVSNIKMSMRMLELAIKQTNLPSAQQAKINQYLQVLNRECEREISLINDLLDLQRLETGQQTAVIEAIELQPWLDRLIQPFRERTRTRQQTIEISMTNLPSPFLCDLTSLERILAELLNNACKYTPLGERIVLQVSACPDYVEFCLTNYGIDIPPDQLSRIFEKFYRIPSADPWKQGGTGLGLALIQKLADYMQGSITVESADLRTCFRLKLPHRDRVSL